MSKHAREQTSHATGNVHFRSRRSNHADHLLRRGRRRRHRLQPPARSGRQAHPARLRHGAGRHAIPMRSIAKTLRVRSGRHRCARAQPRAHRPHRSRAAAGEARLQGTDLRAGRDLRPAADHAARCRVAVRTRRRDGEQASHARRTPTSAAAVHGRRCRRRAETAASAAVRHRHRNPAGRDPAPARCGPHPRLEHRSN